MYFGELFVILCDPTRGAIHLTKRLIPSYRFVNSMLMVFRLFFLSSEGEERKRSVNRVVGVLFLLSGGNSSVG
jgi:hypothetical protein